VALVVLFLSGLFGIVGSLAAGHIVLRTMFRLRPLPWAVHDTFFVPSFIGVFALGPPMLFIGFVVFSMFFKDVELASVHLSDVHQRLFGILIAMGVLLQLLLGQRLALVGEPGVASEQRLRVDRVLFGSVHDLEKGAIAAVELHRTMFNHRFPKIQLAMKSGDTIRLAFGDDIRTDLENWLNQN
jgi:hypothetical protein